MHKGKILLCITLAEQGGAQSFLLKLAIFLQNKGHEVMIVSGRGAWLNIQCEQKHIPYKQIFTLQREIHPWLDWKASRELYTLFQEIKPNAVHLNSTKMGILGSYAAKRAQIKKVVYRIGGWVFLEKLPAWKVWVYKSLEIWTAKWKDTIICVYPGDAAMAKRVGIQPRKQLLGIPNGIDIQDFRKELLPREVARQTLSLSPKELVFGTIANFFPPKNLPTYMEACAHVVRQLPEARFVIIGDGREREAIEQKIKVLHIEKNVWLPGAMEHASSLLEAFDVFVLPSSKEGMSFALLEAMAAGLPCVATKVGAAAYMLEDGRCGWLSSDQDTSQLAEQMIAAARSLPENQKGKLAAEKVERDFPLQKNLEANLQALLS